MLHLLRTKAFIRSVSLLLCGGVLFAQPVTAQYSNPYSRVEMNRTDQDSKPYYFGMSIGINLARFQTELHPVFLQNDSVYVAEPINSGGVTLGFQATARLSNRFQLRFNPQLMFVERNIFYRLNPIAPDINGDTLVTKTIESIIASFPLQLKFQSDRIGNFRVYTLVGIKADIDMASNARAKKAEDLIKIEKYDWGPEFGIGFNFYFPSFIFSPEIKISNGMRNIHSRDPNLRFSSVFDKIQSRMIVFTIHLEG
ncbi:MAG TPA: outer membrane beta-barrel protein [Chitinophagaceae bacterium]|nr:outer membrane beta-barrel protein [Chitinophagaceae bacterium]